MVVRMDVDAAGQVQDAEVLAAVIHSRRRLTYAQAAAVMAEQEHDVSSEEAERIGQLRLVADRLRRVRMQRGALELQLPDSKVLLDEDDPERIRDIVPAKASREIKRAYNLIEELMLAANESVGRIAVARALPVLFRTHEEPDTEKLERLVASAEVLGLKLEVEKLKTPRGVQKFISKLKGHPQSSVLQMLLLRCMAQAVYWAENRPHFALASESYVHFTSPIRRYADLISHRVLKGFLIREGQFEGGASLRKLPSSQECIEAARDSSEQERIIMQVERSVKSVYSAAFMRDKIGETFSGYVSGLSAHGAYVLLDSPNVDGYWPLNRKDEAREYELVDANTKLRSTKTGHFVELGQRVEVEVVDASVIRRQVEFTAAPNTPK